MGPSGITVSDAISKLGAAIQVEAARTAREKGWL
jgi:hypothetical protein